MAHVEIEAVAAAVTAAVAGGAALGAKMRHPTGRSVPPPPPAQCVPAVVDQVDELHGLLARRDPDTGASVVLSHLAELPAIRGLLERIARQLERPSPGE